MFLSHFPDESLYCKVQYSGTFVGVSRFPKVQIKNTDSRNTNLESNNLKFDIFLILWKNLLKNPFKW